MPMSGFAGDREHRCVTLFQIRVVAKQALGRHGIQLECAQVVTKGGSMALLRSTQAGTGSFFERRKSALNSFDW
jgi:hypothetical protein